MFLLEGDIVAREFGYPLGYSGGGLEVVEQIAQAFICRYPYLVRLEVVP
jgi:hypothetical protein